MSRKTVRLKLPENIDDAVALMERVILRNDGVLPAVPASTIYITLGSLVNISVPAVSSGSPGMLPPAPPGTHKIPEEIAAAMRALFPTIKRQYLDYVALRGLLQSVSNQLQSNLGLAKGQTISSLGTGRNLLSRASKVLLGIYAGNENELETYGFIVSVGTAASPTARVKPPA